MEGRRGGGYVGMIDVVYLSNGDGNCFGSHDFSSKAHYNNKRQERLFHFYCEIILLDLKRKTGSKQPKRKKKQALCDM